ncbi:MAG: flagellar type III secretion system pore protein FliP [Phycisphaerae bacterium]|jgi:flagellar biosynthetic protein FliP
MTTAALLALPVVVWAQSPAPSPAIDNGLGLPDLTRVVPVAGTREEMSGSLKVFVILTVLSLAPAILMMTTCFTRILVVLGLLRQAMGTQQLPPSQVVVGLSLFVTFLVMAPTYERIYSQAVRPWLDNAPGMTQSEAIRIADLHAREFMFAQIERTRNEEDIFLFLEYAQRREIPADERITRADVPTRVLIPAFILSELKTAFIIGFRIYLPFLVIDMVIATVLISMGMLMLPPVLISLPFKLLLFVLADGWHLVIGSLLSGFAT